MTPHQIDRGLGIAERLVDLALDVYAHRKLARGVGAASPAKKKRPAALPKAKRPRV